MDFSESLLLLFRPNFVLNLARPPHPISLFPGLSYDHLYFFVVDVDFIVVEDAVEGVSVLFHFATFVLGCS